MQRNLRELHTEYPTLLILITRLWMFDEDADIATRIDIVIQRTSDAVMAIEDKELRNKLHNVTLQWFDKTHELMELVAEATKEE